MLDALMGGVNVVAERGADAGDLVRRDARADAGAADEHAALRPAIPHPRADGLGDIREVDGVGGVRPDVLDLVPPGP